MAFSLVMSDLCILEISENTKSIISNMFNSPELNGKYLGTISSDFIRVSDVLKEASYQLRARKIATYPIFPISKGESSVGQLLIGRKDRPSLAWNYYVSFLEEFTAKGLILSDKKEIFESQYKNPDEFCCLFVIDGDFVNFVFIPYPVEEDEHHD